MDSGSWVKEACIESGTGDHDVDVDLDMDAEIARRD
jgi:hypothetical protein